MQSDFGLVVYEISMAKMRQEVFCVGNAATQCSPDYFILRMQTILSYTGVYLIFV
jgi:hypothetical protein